MRFVAVRVICNLHSISRKGARDEGEDLRNRSKVNELKRSLSTD